MTGQRQHSTDRDRGYTLPELLVTLSVTAILVVAISAALIAMLNVGTQATDRMSESRDISFIQTRVPVDLGSAFASSDEFETETLRADLVDQLGLVGVPVPSLAMLDTLPGTNVLTVVRPDTDGATLVVSYRYEQDGTDWVINRYEFANPGLPSETQAKNSVAVAVAPPPSDLVPAWQPGDPVDFAVDVSPKGSGSRLAGQDFTVTFASGRSFSTGGGGLSAQQSLPPADFPGLGDPLAPPSRCGKRVAIVLDTSGSIPEDNGGSNLQSAAVGFIDGFIGTPTTISLNGFDRTGYGMSILANPVTPELRSPYYSVLNETPEVIGMRNRVLALDALDGLWRNGGSDGPIQPGGTRRDPNGDGIHWDQIRSGSTFGGTNWESGLLTVFRDPSGAIYASEQPDLVVFITDGQPNFWRNPQTNALEFVTDPTVAAEAATAVADDLRGFLGTRIVGVMVGDNSENQEYVGYLKDVLGSRQTEWNGEVGANSNAAEAGLFLGGFSELGNILRSIVIGECGGTLTVQKRIEIGADLVVPNVGTWSYTSNDGDGASSRVLDRALTSSVTFDYSFPGNTGTKTVQLTEQPVDGFVWDRGECTLDGAPVPTSPVGDGTASISVEVPADGALSCLMISRPA